MHGFRRTASGLSALSAGFVSGCGCFTQALPWPLPVLPDGNLQAPFVRTLRYRSLHFGSGLSGCCHSGPIYRPYFPLSR